MVSVDITCDLMDEDETGYVWTFLREARNAALIEPGAIVVAGDPDAPAVAEVVDIVDKSAGAIVHLRVLPGVIEDYEALIRRAITSAPEVWREVAGVPTRQVAAPFASSQERSGRSGRAPFRLGRSGWRRWGSNPRLPACKAGALAS